MVSTQLKLSMFYYNVRVIQEKSLTGSTRASDRSSDPIFRKKFDHLETLLAIHRPKKVLPVGSLCWPLVPNPQSKCPQKEPSYYPKSIMLQLQICYHSHLNASQRTKTNIDFRGQVWVRPLAKYWVKGFILPHKYHPPNFYRRFSHTLAD